MSKSVIRRAAILDFLILSGIPWFASVDPVRNGFSVLKNPYIQIFMFSSGSEHLGQIFYISTGLQQMNEGESPTQHSSANSPDRLAGKQRPSRFKSCVTQFRIPVLLASVGLVFLGILLVASLRMWKVETQVKRISLQSVCTIIYYVYVKLSNCRNEKQILYHAK